MQLEGMNFVDIGSLEKPSYILVRRVPEQVEVPSALLMRCRRKCPGTRKHSDHCLRRWPPKVLDSDEIVISPMSGCRMSRMKFLEEEQYNNTTFVPLQSPERNLSLPARVWKIHGLMC